MLKIIQKISIVVVSSLTAMLRRSKLIVVSLAMFGVWAHYFLKKLMTVIEGNNNRGEIDDRSVASLK